MVLSVALAGCGPRDLTDPDTLPYRFEEVSRHQDRFIAVDLDGDGTDEIIEYGRFNLPEGEAIKIRRRDFEVINQVNFENLRPRPFFLHLDDDRALEILVPVQERDSLFVHVLDKDGKEQQRLFLTSGRPRIEPNKTYQWDPLISDFFHIDVDLDGRRDLVTVVQTQYAGLPRGILAHDLEDGHLIGQAVVGALISNVQPGDFDSDGRPELAFSSSAVDNGARAGGLDDTQSYIGVFDLDGAPTLLWSERMGLKYSNAQLRVVDAPGRPHPLFFVASLPRRDEPIEVYLMDPLTRQVLHRRRYNLPPHSTWTINLDQDGFSEIVLLQHDGTLSVLDEKLNEVQHHYDFEATGIDILPDIDGDGLSEVVLRQRNEQYLLLDARLAPKAFLRLDEGHRLFWSEYSPLLRDGTGEPPLLYVTHRNEETDRAKVIVYRLVANPFYLWHRYGPFTLALLGGGLVLWGAAVGMRRRRRRRLDEDIRTATLGTDDRALLLIHPSNRIEPLNPAARAWAGDLPTVTTLETRYPALAAFLAEAQTPSLHHHERRLEVASPYGPSRVRAVVEPLAAGTNGSYRLLLLGEQHTEQDLQRNRAWGLMAQRVAHDLKNPLTSIRLTLQRLQMEYHDQAPEVAPALDAYSRRIEERIEHLRRLTHNFMKFVDLEEPLLVEADLNAVVQAAGSLLRRGLPPDIDLHLVLADDLPPVLLDREQIESVLENLVMNAVNAMMEGGRITISTQLAPGLLLGDDPAARDYVLLEVLDTGQGMTADVQQRLFEPGFSTTRDGTGLGLALVQKIVADHGGHVLVESEPETGTAFAIYLPAATRESDA